MLALAEVGSTPSVLKLLRKAILKIIREEGGIVE